MEIVEWESRRDLPINLSVAGMLPLDFLGSASDFHLFTLIIDQDPLARCIFYISFSDELSWPFSTVHFSNILMI